MIDFLNQQQDMFEFYRSFIESVVSPTAILFALIVGLGELMLGIALVLGTKVRLACSLGLLMLLNFMLAKGVYPWQFGGDFIYSLLLTLFIASNAGKYWGFDKNDKLSFLRFNKA
jgi:uncharacterized membrane protein YphA (DoxX/SURF4 family)